MRNHIQASAKLLSITLCVSFSLLAQPAWATVTTWDPQALNTQSPYSTLHLDGTWEDNNWSTSQTGQAAPQAWVENTAAQFAVNSGSGTPAFTVTMNANHTVAGMFSGPLTPNPCTVTIQGTGTILLPAGLQGFDINSNASDPGLITIAVPMVDADPANPCVYTAEGSGQAFLNGANTYSGGTLLGYSGSSFSGILNFNSSSSFGTGGICISNTSSSICALVAEGTAAITIPNNMTNAATGGLVSGTKPQLHIVAPSGGLTFSGEWDALGQAKIGVGPSGTTTTISGVMKGPGGVTYINGTGSPGTLALTGPNTFTGSVTNNPSASTGIMVVNSIADSGTSALGLGPNLALAGGTFRYSGAAAATTSRACWLTAASTLDLPAGPLTLNGAFLSSNSGNALTKTGAGTLTLGGTADNASLAVAVTAGTVVFNKTSDSGHHAVGSAYVRAANGGTIQLSGSGGAQFWSGSCLTVTNGGVFDMNGLSESFLAVTNAGTGISKGGALINSAASTTSTLTLSGGMILSGNSSVGGAGNITIPSVISGGFALTNVGTGTLTLSGANTYSGGTTVKSGTVLVNNSTGSGTGTGAVTVNSGGTLNVSGTITGTTLAVNSGGTLGSAGSSTGNINATATVNAGGTLSLADGVIDTLTFGSGGVTLAGTTSLEIEEDIQTGDTIASSGTITLGGNLTVTQLDPADTFALNDTFYLFNGTLAGGFSSYTLPTLPAGLVWDKSHLAPGGDGSIAVIVAPSTSPQATSLSPLPDGNISLMVTGAIGSAWSLHATDNVAAPQPWPVITNGTLTISPTNVDDLTATNFSQRFYRFSTP